MTKIGDAYRWIYGRVTERPTNFSWVIPGHLAGSGLPATREELEWILRQGIRSIITVRESPLPMEWLDSINEEKHGQKQLEYQNSKNNSNNKNNNENHRIKIDYLYLRVEDFGVPSLDELDSTVDHIKEQMDVGNPVMVHCAAGKGRAGTVLAAFFLKNEGLGAVEAIEKIRSLRPGSVQSERQEMLLSMYEKYLKDGLS